MLPNLIVIGAEKCGTTALYYYLAHHPEVTMSREKELRFFSGPRWQRGTEWYASCFAGAATPVVGEASPQYTAFPAVRDVPERMHSVVPQAKLVYLVRDPIERLVSRYVDKVAASLERRPFGEAVQATPSDGSVMQSSYATQLEQFLPFYPAERIRVLAQEDLLARRRETLRRLFAFCGIDESFDSPRFDEIRHPSVQKRRMRLGPLLPAKLSPKPTGRIPWEVRAKVKRTVFRPFSVPIERPRIAPAHREALHEVLAPEADRLRAITGEPFPDWSV